MNIEIPTPDDVRRIFKEELRRHETEIGYKLLDRDIEFLSEQCVDKVMMKLQLSFSRLLSEAKTQLQTYANKLGNNVASNKRLKKKRK